MRYLLNAVYVAMLVALSPVLFWRSVRYGRYRRGLTEKLAGLLPRMTSQKPVAWFHAVSVGEVIQLQKVVTEFERQTEGRYAVVVSSSTDTGYDLAVKRFPDAVVTWFPLDFSWSVGNALRRIHPDLVVLMELELWPNLIMECSRQNVPVAVINARMSDHSIRGYRRIRRLISPIIGRLSLVAAQSSQYAERLLQLGAVPERVFVTGSVKFDGVLIDRSNPHTVRLGALLGIGAGETLLIAGSTQAPEEQIVLRAWQRLRSEFPNLRLLLVPRHKERFDEVAQMCVAAGESLIRRSQISAAGPEQRNQDAQNVSAADHKKGLPVLLLDTIGELSAAWGLADLAFVGGSFGSRGGQNMIEPAALGAAVLLGPNTSNFRDVVAAFRHADACIQLDAPEQFEIKLRQLLSRRELRTELGRKARHVVMESQGATAVTCQLLNQLVARNLPPASHRENDSHAAAA